MATLRDRLNALLRYRVGKYDSQTLANDLGIYGTTVSGANINENTALTISHGLRLRVQDCQHLGEFRS